MLTNSQRLAILQPLSKPCENLRYTLTYETIYEARSYDDLEIPQGVWQRDLKKADWQVVKDTCVQALTTSTKDLHLCCFLAEALLNLEGIDGLVQGLELFKDVSEAFWDTLMPPIEEGDDMSFRLMCFEWLDYHIPKSLVRLPIASTAKSPLFYEWMSLRGETEWDASAVLSSKMPPSRCLLRKILDEVEKTPFIFYKNLEKSLDKIEALLKNLERFWSECASGPSPSFSELRRALSLLGLSLPSLEKASFDPENDRLQKALSPLVSSAEMLAQSPPQERLGSDLIREAQTLLKQSDSTDFQSPKDAYEALEKALSYLKNNPSN